MKVYVTLCCDRHCDPEVKVFSTSELAIEYAKQFMKDCCSYPEEIEEHDYEGLLYHATYSCESDYVQAQECEVIEC